MEIIYTKHAIKEMYSHGIEVSKIEDTIIHGDKKIESKKQNKYRSVKRYGNVKIHVIFRIINENVLKVITCKKVRV